MNTHRHFSTRPLYLQVRDALVQKYAGTDAPPGALPNEESLAREYGVSPGTVRKALTTLVNERVLTRRPGRGTFISDPASGELAIRFSNIRSSDGQRVSGSVAKSTIEIGLANEAEREQLNLHANAQVFRIKRVRHDQGHPFMVEDVALPAAIFPDLDKRPDRSHRVTLLARQYGILLGKATEKLRLAAASPDIATALEVAPESPVLVLDRLVLALDSRPVEWRIGYCNLGDKQHVADMN